jgi:hypothetical protein
MTAAALDTWLIFEDEAGCPMTPPTTRTWSRRSHTPIVRPWSLPPPLIHRRPGLLQTRTTVPADPPAAARHPSGRTQELRLDRLPRPHTGRPPPTRRPDCAGVGQPQHPPGIRDAPLHRRPRLAHRLPAAPPTHPTSTLSKESGPSSVARRWPTARSPTLRTSSPPSGRAYANSNTAAPYSTAASPGALLPHRHRTSTRSVMTTSRIQSQ